MRTGEYKIGINLIRRDKKKGNYLKKIKEKENPLKQRVL